MKKLCCGFVALVMVAGIGSSRAADVQGEGKITVAPAGVNLGANTQKTTWLTSFSDAKAEAAKRKVPILADFSGSDWCGWCKKLDREVFSTPAFKNYAAKNLVLLLVDFPQMKKQTDAVKKQNGQMQEQYGVNGYPTVILMDAEGKVLGQTGYQPGGGDAYVTHLKDLLNKK